MPEVFVDTSYFIATINPRDALHDTAKGTGRTLSHHRFVTTDAVLAELLGYYAAYTPFLRASALRTVDRVHSTSTFEVLDFGRPQFTRALERYRSRPDKTYSLIDCHSMIVMEECGIRDILTSDEHFLQAGFTCLLPTGGRAQ